MSRTRLARRKPPAESWLGRRGEKGDRTENKRERERETNMIKVSDRLLSIKGNKVKQNQGVEPSNAGF